MDRTTSLIPRTYSIIARRFLSCLLLLMLGIKGVVPTGYMPDTAAIKGSQFAITLCTADGKLTNYLLSIDSSHEDTSPASVEEMSCVFGMLALQAVIPLLDTAYRLPPATADPASPDFQQHFHIRDRLALGPPLGSRAPPFTLN